MLKQSASTHRNLWALIVLAFLYERPMHPYEMQILLRQRHKDDLLVLKRGSFYHAVDRLHRGDLIEPMETAREGKRPERTIYRLTESGEEELFTWLRELIAKPGHAPSDFLAAISLLGILPPQEALEQLQDRTVILKAEVAGLDVVLDTLVPQIGRLPLLETEYARAMRQAELEWVHSLTEDLRTARLTWSVEELFQHQHGDKEMPHLPDTESKE